MVLESTMICVDDSDFMRNGDFTPTRMAAMQDAVQLVCTAKTRQNPENNVGLLTLASSEVLSTLTTDPNKLISKLLAVQPEGELKFLSGLRVAHLALKHRQGKNHRMRIIVFIGSPLNGLDAEELVRQAKKFKKEKVNVDIISFGDGNQDVLQKFIDTLNGEEGTNSRLVVVPPGPSLTTALVGSPILVSEDGINMGGVGGGGGFDFGIDPNDDPELALALRVSMEEQRARQEAENRSTGTDKAAEAGPTHEEQMLEQALAMSMGGGSGGTSSSVAAGGVGGSGSGSAGAGNTSGAAGGGISSANFAAMTEDEQIAYALQMSMQDNTFATEDTKMETADSAAVIKSEGADIAGGGSEDVEMEDAEGSSGASAVAKKSKTDQQVSDDFKTVMNDTAFLQQVLENLPEGSQQPPIKQETIDAANNLVKEKAAAAAAKTKTSPTTAKKSTTSSGSPKSPSSGSSGSGKKSSGGNNDNKDKDKKKKPEPKK